MLLQTQITNNKVFKSSTFAMLLTFVGIIATLILFSLSFPQKNHQDIQALDQKSYPHLRSETFTSVHVKSQEKRQKIETLRNLTVDYDTFLMAITIGCIVVGVIGILLCIFCAIRVFVYPVHPLVTVSESSLEIGNHKVYPVISYQVFKNYVGKPLVEKCCYCSSNFQQNISTQTHLNDDRLEEIVQENQDKNEEKDQQKKISSSSIQMTVCGHLVHHLCFGDFLEKQKIKKCPVCQESLAEQKLRQWENKIGINIEKLYDEHYKNQELEFADERIEQTLQQFSPELGSDPCCKKTIQNADLSQNQTYAISIYSKIYKYHQDTGTDCLRQIFPSKQNNLQQIAFAPQQQPQTLSDPKNSSQSEISPRKESVKQEKKQDPNKRFSQDTIDSEKGYTIIVARRRSNRYSIQSMSSY